MTGSLPADKLWSAAESAVVALARLGDQSGFEELVRRRQSSIRSLFRRLSHNASLADDLSQETFLQAWKQIRHLKSVGAFGGWLRQVAVNVWLQHIRSRVRFADLDSVVEEATGTLNTSMQLDLDFALSQLTPAVRLCIVLNYHEGLSHAEIASMTQLPLGTVKSHITRGTARLRELLAAYEATPERRRHVR